MRIERLQPPDLPAYKRLMLHAYSAAADAFTTTAGERAAEPDAWWLKRIADPSGMSVAFGAFEGAELVGTVTIEFASKSKTRHKAHVVGMFVRESARGRGAGRLLMQAALEAAAQHPGVRIVTLTVTQGNDKAIALYRSMGFVAFGTEPMAIATDDGFKGKVHMTLQLESARPATPLVLYTGPLSMFGAKAQIALLEKGVGAEVVMVAYDSQRGYEPKHPEVLRINPKRQVPVLVHGGLEIFDSTQIFEYLEDLEPDPPLWPRDIRARAQARLLEHQSDEVYFPHVIRLMGLQQELAGEAACAAIDAATRYYARMDALLADRDYLAGDYSYADIAFYMAALFGERQGAALTEVTPRLLAWRDRMSQRAAVKQVAGAMADWLSSVGRPVPAFMEALRVRSI